MTKKELRKIYIEKRDKLTVAEKDKLDDLLLIQFQKLPIPFFEFLFSFQPMEHKNEINTHLISGYLSFINPGLKIAYPVTDMDSCEMKAMLTDEETIFEPNAHHIHEPLNGEEILAEELDVILVPLLAFDKQGHRVGYGKGFYARYLSAC